MKRILAGLVCGAMVVSVAFAIADTPEVLKELNESLPAGLEKCGVPSLAVGVIRDGKVIFNRAYGWSDLKKRTAATPDTIYRIGSCSKAFAAAALGVLVDRGALKWTDRVRDHLPEFRLRDAYVTEHATIEDLLTHRVGFKAYDGDLLWYRTGYNAREILTRIGRLPLSHGFREAKGYSNIMYLVAQRIVERISGVPYRDFVQRNLFKPMGMRDASLTFARVADKAEFALPYKRNKELVPEPLDAIPAAGGVNASMNDMLKWVGMLLAGGKSGDNQVLSETVVNSFFVPRMINPIGGLEQYMGLKFSLYGLGWNLYPYHNRKVVVHQGALPGYIANVLLVPEEKLGVVVMCNELTMLSFGVSRKILDLLLGVEGKKWIADAPRFDQWLAAQEKAGARQLDALRRPDTHPSLALDEYCGRYADPYYGHAKVSLRQGRLHLSLEPTRGKLAGDLEHHHLNSFRVDFKDPYIPAGLVTFHLDADGKIFGFSFRIRANDFNFENLRFTKQSPAQ